MKKVISLILILFLVGCGKEEFANCDIEINNDIQNYNMNGSYKIYYYGNYVTRIEKSEKYISDDENVIKYFNDSKDLEYSNLNDIYGGYNYTIKSDETSVNTNILIDVNLVNLKKMVKDKKEYEDYIVGNKLTISGIVRFYESKGAVCNI